MGGVQRVDTRLDHFAEFYVRDKGWARDPARLGEPEVAAREKIFFADPWAVWEVMPRGAEVFRYVNRVVVIVDGEPVPSERDQITTASGRFFIDGKVMAREDVIRSALPEGEIRNVLAHMESALVRHVVKTPSGGVFPFEYGEDHVILTSELRD